LGYDLTEVPPDHSGLTRISERYEVAVFRRFFEAIVEQCFIEKLVWEKSSALIRLTLTLMPRSIRSDHVLPTKRTLPALR